ncbi:hypothetical protein GPECTOR_7g1196 [Gonium pectorale]|uniref:Uncharacterized protein n=1 Tax=Gonium pectorale TaxID=33097 RepID=A0A150GU88_GONPE|nr:hypothetical protein GPECTOR_7g1196 [Gonium pectorale]|eukprot:KXZ53302.1 hypothetical protein GPECTOR_7g1196 [Gonium pectorale]
MLRLLAAATTVSSTASSDGGSGSTGSGSAGSTGSNGDSGGGVRSTNSSDSGAHSGVSVNGDSPDKAGRPSLDASGKGGCSPGDGQRAASSCQDVTTGTPRLVEDSARQGLQLLWLNRQVSYDASPAELGMCDQSVVALLNLCDRPDCAACLMTRGSLYGNVECIEQALAAGGLGPVDEQQQPPVPGSEPRLAGPADGASAAVPGAARGIGTMILSSSCASGEGDGKAGVRPPMLMPLGMAAANGHEDALRLLLEQRVDDPNVCDKFGLPALWFAVEHAQPGCVRLLLQAGARAADWVFATPSVAAAAQGVPPAAAAERTAAERASAAAAAGLPPAVASYMCLCHAVEVGDVRTVRELLRFGACPYTPDDSNGTPYHMAIERGDVEVVEALLDGDPAFEELQRAQADVYRRLLHASQRVERSEVAGCPCVQCNYRVAIRAAASPETEELRAQLQLVALPVVMDAAPPESAVALMELMRSRGALLDAHDADGYTALHLAVRAGNLDAIRWLLQQLELSAARLLVEDARMPLGSKTTCFAYEADVRAEEKKLRAGPPGGLSAAAAASRSARRGAGGAAAAAANKKRSRDPMLTVPLYGGHTPAQLALRYGRPLLLAYLLHRGAPMDLSSATSRHCLEKALEAGHSAAARILLSYVQQGRPSAPPSGTAALPPSGSTSLEGRGKASGRAAKRAAASSTGGKGTSREGSSKVAGASTCRSAGADAPASAATASSPAAGSSADESESLVHLRLGAVEDGPTGRLVSVELQPAASTDCAAGPSVMQGEVAGQNQRTDAAKADIADRAGTGTATDDGTDDAGGSKIGRSARRRAARREARNKAATTASPAAAEPVDAAVAPGPSVATPSPAPASVKPAPPPLPEREVLSAAENTAAVAGPAVTANTSGEGPGDSLTGAAHVDVIDDETALLRAIAESLGGDDGGEWQSQQHAASQPPLVAATPPKARNGKVTGAAGGDKAPSAYGSPATVGKEPANGKAGAPLPPLSGSKLNPQAHEFVPVRSASAGSGRPPSGLGAAPPAPVHLTVPSVQLTPPGMSRKGGPHTGVGAPAAGAAQPQTQRGPVHGASQNGHVNGRAVTHVPTPQPLGSNAAVSSGLLSPAVSSGPTTGQTSPVRRDLHAAHSGEYAHASDAAQCTTPMRGGAQAHAGAGGRASIQQPPASPVAQVMSWQAVQPIQVVSSPIRRLPDLPDLYRAMVSPYRSYVAHSPRPSATNAAGVAAAAAAAAASAAVTACAAAGAAAAAAAEAQAAASQHHSQVHSGAQPRVSASGGPLSNGSTGDAAPHDEPLCEPSTAPPYNPLAAPLPHLSMLPHGLYCGEQLIRPTCTRLWGLDPLQQLRATQTSLDATIAAAFGVPGYFTSIQPPMSYSWDVAGSGGGGLLQPAHGGGELFEKGPFFGAAFGAACAGEHLGPNCECESDGALDSGVLRGRMSSGGGMISGINSGIVRALHSIFGEEDADEPQRPGASQALPPISNGASADAGAGSCPEVPPAPDAAASAAPSTAVAAAGLAAAGPAAPMGPPHLSRNSLEPEMGMQSVGGAGRGAGGSAGGMDARSRGPSPTPPGHPPKPHGPQSGSQLYHLTAQQPPHTRAGQPQQLPQQQQGPIQRQLPRGDLRVAVSRSGPPPGFHVGYGSGNDWRNSVVRLFTSACIPSAPAAAQPAVAAAALWWTATRQAPEPQPQPEDATPTPVPLNGAPASGSGRRGSQAGWHGRARRGNSGSSAGGGSTGSGGGGLANGLAGQQAAHGLVVMTQRVQIVGPMDADSMINACLQGRLSPHTEVCGTLAGLVGPPPLELFETLGSLLTAVQSGGGCYLLVEGW